MSICQTVSVHESKPWDSENYRYDESAPTNYTVTCPAHGRVYEGQNSENALALQGQHREPAIICDRCRTRSGTRRSVEICDTCDDVPLCQGCFDLHQQEVMDDIDESDVPMPRPPYGSTKGDGSEEDKLWTLYNRWELKAMKLRFSRVRSTLEMFFGLAPGSKLGFSRKAGCGMCPCSPGFILQGQVRYNQVRWGSDFPTPVDLHVSKAFGSR